MVVFTEQDSLGRRVHPTEHGQFERWRNLLDIVHALSVALVLRAINPRCARERRLGKRPCSLLT